MLPPRSPSTFTKQASFTVHPSLGNLVSRYPRQPAVVFPSNNAFPPPFSAPAEKLSAAQSARIAPADKIGRGDDFIGGSLRHPVWAGQAACYRIEWAIANAAAAVANRMPRMASRIPVNSPGLRTMA